MQRKSSASPDIVVTRLVLSRNDGCGIMVPHSTVRRKACLVRGGEREGGAAACPDFHHAFGGGGGGGGGSKTSLLAVACAHGTVTLHDHVRGGVPCQSRVRRNNRNDQLLHSLFPPQM